MTHANDNPTRYEVNIQRTKAQAMVEFALILPIALILIFTTIELARMAQAWLVVTNSARVGVRVAVTGVYDVDYCTTAIDFNSNGEICEQETDDEERNDEIDAARLLTIYDQTEDSAIAIMKDLSVTTYGEPGYFDVTVCSTNNEEDSDGNEIIRIFHPPPNEYCDPSDHPGDPSAGAARVLVAVTFEHPVILPILNSIAPSVTLHSERTGIVEQFRVARVLGLPPIIAVPTATSPPPTETNTATNTPSSTATIAPTDTATSDPNATPTPTRTNTPSPTITLTATTTRTPTITLTATTTRTPTITLTPSETPTPSNTPTSTDTPSITPTQPTTVPPTDTSTPPPPTETIRPTLPGGG
jgi:hypothetical protein